jgi:hypothetical protein
VGAQARGAAALIAAKPLNLLELLSRLGKKGTPCGCAGHRHNQITFGRSTGE